MKKDQIVKIINGLSDPAEVSKLNQWLAEGKYDDEFNSLFGQELNAKLNSVGGELQEEQILLMLTKLKQRISKHSNPEPKKGVSKFLNDVKWNYPWYAKVAATVVIFVFTFIFTLSLVDLKRQEHQIITELKMIRKQTLAGQKLSFQLPDGTMVILNSASVVEYSSEYGSSKRSIDLDGEAYFEVFSDVERPFVVNMNDINVTALGTAFNACNRDNTIKVALTEGLVGIMNNKDLNAYLELSPGQMATGKLMGDQWPLKVSQFDPELVVGWKNGKLTFKSKPLGEITNNLESWYGVDFQFQGNVDINEKISGEFENENLTNIMDGLTFTLGLSYEITDKKVIIKKK